MDHEDGKQTKIVRYSGSTETQSIQWDYLGKPIYTSGGYLCENRNFEICVNDRDAHSVVVVSAAGELRFRCTGPPSTMSESFYLLGINTDSWGSILTSDGDNHRIHIIDQNIWPIPSLHSR